MCIAPGSLVHDVRSDARHKPGPGLLLEDDYTKRFSCSGTACHYSYRESIPPQPWRSGVWLDITKAQFCLLCEACRILAHSGRNGRHGRQVSCSNAHAGTLEEFRVLTSCALSEGLTRFVAVHIPERFRRIHYSGNGISPYGHKFVSEATASRTCLRELSQPESQGKNMPDVVPYCLFIILGIGRLICFGPQVRWNPTDLWTLRWLWICLSLERG